MANLKFEEEFRTKSRNILQWFWDGKVPYKMCVPSEALDDLEPKLNHLSTEQKFKQCKALCRKAAEAKFRAGKYSGDEVKVHYEDLMQARRGKFSR
jgi:hypothetical protein